MLVCLREHLVPQGDRLSISWISYIPAFTRGGIRVDKRRLAARTNLLQLNRPRPRLPPAPAACPRGVDDEEQGRQSGDEADEGGGWVPAPAALLDDRRVGLEAAGLLPLAGLVSRGLDSLGIAVLLL